MKKTLLFLFISLLAISSILAVGGDTPATAENISVLPYNDSGNTSSGYTNYIGNTSADAWYLINSVIELTNVTFDLTGSSFDTFMRVYDSTETQLWSDDDGGSGNTSKISGKTLSANTDYYICVEGYSGNTGAYILNVSANETGNINDASAPTSISNVSPIAGTTEIALQPTLTWDFGDNTETYDLYLDTDNPPQTLVVNNAEAGVSGSFTPEIDLVEYTTYYWMVVSKSSTSSELQNIVNSFTTVDLVAGEVTNPNPGDNGLNIDINPTITWDFAANTETYDLYFDTVNPPVNQVVTDGIATTGSYTPSELALDTEYYWTVISKNSVSFRTTENTFSFRTKLADNIVPIGYGTVVDRGLPVDPYFGYTYSQSIYLQSEIDFANQRIQKIWYHYNGSSDLEHTSEWVIYMGHTSLTEFATNTDWISIDNLLQVASVTLDPYPTEEGWIEFVLDTPFVYNNVDNLVIAVEDNQSGYETSSDEFYCSSVTGSRSIMYRNDNTNPDPVAPPVAAGIYNYIPNIRMEFGDIPEAPQFSINPESKDFGTVLFDVTDSQLFTINNTGGTDLIIDTPIAMETESDFTMVDSNTYPLSIAPGAAATFTVEFTPTVAGPATDNIVIIDNTTRASRLIPVSGEGVDPIVRNFPHTQSFDEPTLPAGWVIDPVVAGDSWEIGNDELGGHGATAEATGNGGYMMVIDDSTPETVPSHLYSPQFDLTGLTNPILEFKYWIGDNSNTSELHIDIITSEETFTSVTVLSDSNGASDWATCIVNLQAYTGQLVSIDFRGMEGSGYEGDISIDDIYIFNNTNPPAVTTLVSPLNEATDLALSGNLEWNPVNYANGYLVNFGTDNPPTNVLDSFDNASSVAYEYSGLSTGTVYYWQIIPYNGNGNANDCPVWSFTTTSSAPDPATNPSPSDGATNRTQSGTFSWNASLLAEGYYFCLGTDNPPTNMENMHDNGTNLDYTYVDFSYGTTYYWQVIPYNAAGNAVDCPVWSMTIMEDPRIYPSYLQTFNQSSSLPNKWTSNMGVRASWGLTNSNVLYKNLYSSVSSCYAELNNVTSIDPNDYVSFYYRLVDYSGAPNNPTTLGEGDSVVLSASINDGEEYTPLYTINQNNHTPTTAWRKITLPIDTFVGNDVKFRFDCTWNNGDYYIMIDNFFVGPIEANIIISEVNAGTVQYVELYNAGTISASIEGWHLDQFNPAISTIFSYELETNLPENMMLYSGKYVTIIGGTYEQFIAEYPGFNGYYIADGDASVGVPQISNNSWFRLDDGTAKTTIDQFGSETAGASVGTIYERNDAESSGDDIANDWTPVIAPTPGIPNENDLTNDNALPIQLTSFVAENMTTSDEGSFVQLEWVVESESNISGYNIYRNNISSEDSYYQINSGIIVANNLFSQNQYIYKDTEVEVSNTFYYWLESVSIDGISQFFGPVEITIEENDTPDTPEVPFVTSMNSVYPNPFNPTTQVSFSLKSEENVTISVYNIKGELISVLYNGMKPQGKNVVSWDGINRHGKACGSGIYFFRMKTKGYTAVKKATLLK